jgi:hypothetical protein
MEIIRETIASSGCMLKDKAMVSSIFPRRRRVMDRVGIMPLRKAVAGALPFVGLMRESS